MILWYFFNASVSGKVQNDFNIYFIKLGNLNVLKKVHALIVVYVMLYKAGIYTFEFMYA